MYGNDAIWVVIPRNGVTKGVQRDEGIFDEFLTVRLVQGRLTAEGRRLDGPAPPPHFGIPDGYGTIGFQAFGVTFPTPGCWEITQRVDGKELRFVVRVEGRTAREAQISPLTMGAENVSWMGPSGQQVTLTRDAIDAALPPESRGRQFEFDSRLSDMTADGQYVLLGTWPSPRALVVVSAEGVPMAAYVAPPHPCYVFNSGWIPSKEIALIQLAGPGCGRLLTFTPSGDIEWDIATETLKANLYVSPDEAWVALEQRFEDATDLYEFVSTGDPSIRFVVNENERPASTEHGIAIEGIGKASGIRDSWIPRGQLASTVGLLECPVTIGSASNQFGERGRYGSAGLSTVVWPEGTTVFRPGGPGFVDRDGSLGMKWPWTRGDGVVGKLTIEGRRLDAPAPPLQANIPEGYGDRGFQSTALIFPTEGCWEVTGRADDATLTFVTLVVKIAEGPSWRP
ncbi:MAG: hypothetical protein HY678_10040 [Chloroflexi bacterium]|nr:hypothetical protein [Chloroflexota bacterium]